MFSITRITTYCSNPRATEFIEVSHWWYVLKKLWLLDCTHLNNIFVSDFVTCDIRVGPNCLYSLDGLACDYVAPAPVYYSTWLLTVLHNCVLSTKLWNCLHTGVLYKIHYNCHVEIYIHRIYVYNMLPHKRFFVLILWLEC